VSDTWSPPPSPPSTPPPGYPSPPSPPPIGRGRIVAGALVGVLIVLVVAFTAALAIGDDDGDRDATALPATTDAPSNPAPSTTEPGTSGSAPANPLSADIDAFLDEAISFVEAERSRSFATRPTVEVLAEAAFVERYTSLLDEAIAEDPQGFEAAEVVYKALGLIQPDSDLREVEASFGAAGVLAFYNTETNVMVLRDGELTPLARTVIVHELVPALDDQTVELYRPEFDDAKDEIGFGQAAVAEGNARRIENAYRATLTPDERRDAAREEAGYGANLSLDDFTIAYLLLQIAPYEYGEPFVEDLLAAGGEDAVDAALREPPRNSEQVLDFDKYQAREPRVEVAPPPADGVVLEDGVFGEVALVALLTAVVGGDVAADAASGWSGDWYVAWREGSASCLRATFVMDTDGDRRELLDALDEWADDQGDHVDVQSAGAQVDLTSCVN
jgi:hypothetical protein